MNDSNFTGDTKLVHLRNAVLVVVFLCFGCIAYADSGMKQFNLGNFEKARQLWDKALQKSPDSAELHYNLALLFDKGLGTQADPTQATRHYLKAADQDYAPAMFNLGVIMAKQKNYLSAAKWWLKAAEADLPEAQYNLAKLYSEGLGVKQDVYRAKYWFKKAAQTAISKYDSLNAHISVTKNDPAAMVSFSR